MWIIRPCAGISRVQYRKCGPLEFIKLLQAFEKCMHHRRSRFSSFVRTIAQDRQILAFSIRHRGHSQCAAPRCTSRSSVCAFRLIALDQRSSPAPIALSCRAQSTLYLRPLIKRTDSACSTGRLTPVRSRRSILAQDASRVFVSDHLYPRIAECKQVWPCSAV